MMSSTSALVNFSSLFLASFSRTGIVSRGDGVEIWRYIISSGVMYVILKEGLQAV
jgi:hypothetical protein